MTDYDTIFLKVASSLGELALPFNNNAFILFVVLEFVFALAYSHT